MRSRARRVLVATGQCLALGTVFVSAALGAVVLHSDARAMRRLVTGVANDALSSLFLGKLVIGEVTHLSLGTTTHVQVKEVVITDPEGRSVIVAHGVDAKIDLGKLVRSIASGGPPDVSLVDETRIDEAEVVVDLDAKGDLGIARAFEARPSATPKPVTPPLPNQEDVRLSIPKARLGHARVHGNLVPPRLDADADDVRAGVFIAGNRFTVEAEQARITARSPHAPSQTGPIHGMAHGSLLVPLGTTPGAPPGLAGSGIVMRWELEGDAAGVPLKAHFGLDGDKMDATADIAPVAPDVLRKAMPLLPITKPVEVHAKAVGTVAELDITAHGKVGASAFDAKGRLGLGAPQPFRVDVDLKRLDAAAFTGPESDVSGHVHVEGAITAGAPKGTFTVVTEASTIAAQSAPAVNAEGTFDERSVKATFRASEPGAAVSGKVEVHIPEQKLAFDASVRSNDLKKLARAPGVVSGAATAHATGTVDLARSTVDARVTVDGSGIARAPATAGDLHAEARITGPVADPVIDVTARAAHVALAATEAEAGAGKKKPLVYPAATARARIVLSPTPTIRDAEVHVEGTEAGTAVDAKAREIVIGPGGVDVRGTRVTGLGAPLDVDVQLRGGALSVRAKGENVDMKRLAAMTGVQELRLLPEGSRASLDVDVKAAATRTDGHVDVVIAGAKDGSTAELHAKLEGRHVAARARVAIGALGWMEVQRAELELPGGLSVANARRATGALDLRGEIDLAQGVSMIGGESIEQITGTALLSARIERGDERNLPTVYASAVTRALDVTIAGEGRSTHIGGIDGSLHVGYDGATDETELSALTWDAKGIVGSADAKARVPLVGWATGVKPFDRATVGALQVAAIVDVPRREVASLPGALARPDLRGALAAHAELGGTIASPRVTLLARADDLREKQRANAGARFAPIDGTLEARWDGKDVVAALRIDEQDRPDRPERNAARADERAPAARTAERKSGHVRGLVIGRLPVEDLLAGRPPAWNASGELDVADLELAPLPLPRNLRGALTGRVKLRDLTGSPLLDARAHVTDLGVGGVRVTRGDVKVEAKNGSLSANARVRDAEGGTGEAKILSSSLRWHGTQVGWDDAQPTRVDYKVDGMHLAILRPFVRTIIPEIDGRVDGSGSAVVDASSQVFEGGLALTDGRLYVNALGEEITGLHAVATFERHGAFRVQEIRGRIGAGELKASASGHMKGLRFDSAEMVVVIPTKDGVPLSAEGATFAEATGEVRLGATMSPDRKSLLVTVAVPRSKITLPDRGTQNLQPLERDETIEVGIRQKDGSLAPQALRPGEKRAEEAAAAARAAAESGDPSTSLTAKLSVSLGDDVMLEGRGLRIYLGGKTVVEIAEEIAVTGQITLRNGGTIDVQGRKFVVDRGTVSFVEGDEPSNPIVIAAAYWDAPDRTRVWVEFNGPLKTGKLTLRSEPPYSKNEILSILLFGRADPNQAKAGDARPSDAQAATAVGTGIASSGLNKALGELDEDFDLEQDRTSANRVRTKLGYRLRRNLKVQLGYASGFSQREPDTTYLFVEWQFIPKWSLIGTRGDRGTSILDVIFQHRY